jgi:hypothetical protein
MSNKTYLQGWFWAVIVAMLAATTWASLEKNVLAAFADLGADRWGLATLMDAYFAFIAFYLWIAYKETSWTARVVWFVLMLGFGNFVISGYALWQLANWDPKTGAAGLLLRAEPKKRRGRR